MDGIGSVVGQCDVTASGGHGSYTVGTDVWERLYQCAGVAPAVRAVTSVYRCCTRDSSAAP